MREIIQNKLSVWFSTCSINPFSMILFNPQTLLLVYFAIMADCDPRLSYFTFSRSTSQIIAFLNKHHEKKNRRCLRVKLRRWGWRASRVGRWNLLYIFSAPLFDLAISLLHIVWFLSPSTWWTLALSSPYITLSNSL